MKSAIIFVFFLTITRFVNGQIIVCFYNPDVSQNFGLADLEKAASYCDHIVYGHAIVNPDDYRIVSLRPQKELPTGDDYYRKVTGLKKKYPHLRIYLGIGGPNAPNKEIYLSLLENESERTTVSSSLYNFARVYGFDGVDIAWPFPEVEPKKRRGFFKKFWHGVKNFFSKADDNEEEHREQFTLFIKQLTNFCQVDNLSVTVSINPNVNTSIYFDMKQLMKYVDQIHLHAYDFYTPERNPHEADLTAPLKGPVRDNRYDDANIESHVQYCLKDGLPAEKLVLVIPTYGRTWKMTTESSINGFPPIIVDGPGEKGPITKTEGLLSYYEIWKFLNSPFKHEKLARVEDTSKFYGSFAFRLPDADGEHGMWVSYDDITIMNHKTIYAKTLRLRGIGVYNITHDDPTGLTGSQYPILSTVKSTLKVMEQRVAYTAARGALVLGRKHK